MKTAKSSLLIVFAVLLGLARWWKESPEHWLDAPALLLVAVIIAWFPLSRLLLRFIDARNHSHRLAGLAGFLGLFIAILAVEGLSFTLKGGFAPARDLSASFLDDAAWLIILPLVYHQMTSAKKPDKPSEAPLETAAPHADGRATGPSR